METHYLEKVQKDELSLIHIFIINFKKIIWS